jgi:hypothetical protein
VLLALAAGAFASAQTADAIVAKFPSASIPSTVTIAASGVAGLPGKRVSVPFTMTLAGAAPSSFQFDLSYDPTRLTFVSASAGPGLTAAGIGLTTTVISSSDVRLATSGSNPDGIAGGMVVCVVFTIAPTFNVTFTTLTTMNCVSTVSGTPLSTGCSGAPVSRAVCTVSGDAAAGVVDVQTMLNQLLGVSPAVNDLNGDGVVNIADAQMVVGAAMGLGCLQ